jgi:hypothetical protein
LKEHMKDREGPEFPFFKELLVLKLEGGDLIKVARKQEASRYLLTTIVRVFLLVRCGTHICQCQSSKKIHSHCLRKR